MCSEVVNHFSGQQNWQGTGLGGGGEDLRGLFMVHCL